MNSRPGIYTIAFAVIITAAAIFLSRRPYYNWDMFPYMSIALADPSVPFDSTHAQTYLIAQQAMLPADFEGIASRQQLLREDPQAFRGILKYFTIKPGYNLAVKSLYLAGVNLVKATWLPSLIAWVFIGGLLFWWTSEWFPQPFAAVISLLTLALPALTDTARYSSPDLLSAAILFLGLRLLSSSSTLPGIISLLIAVFFRPDHAVFVVCIAFALRVSGTLSRQGFVLTSLIALLSSLWLIGRPTLLEFVFIDLNPGDPVSWTVYFQGLTSGAQTIVRAQAIPFILFALAALYLRSSKANRITDDRGSLLLIAALATMVTRYLLHPRVEDRFLIPCYLLILMEFYRAAGQKWNSPEPRSS